MGVLWFFDLNVFIKKYNTTTFFETGTGGGTGIEYASRFPFNKIYSCDLVPELIEEAKKKFIDPRIKLINTSSNVFLMNELQDIENENILFWLDAHFPGMDHSKDGVMWDVPDFVKLPLETELETIKRMRPKNKDVILIDDVMTYIEGSFELDYYRKFPPIGNIDFVYNLFSETHNITISRAHTGYIMLEPKENV